MNLLEKAKDFVHGIRIITDWLGSGGQCVDPALAQRRTNICLSCHKNVGGMPMIEKAAEIVREQLEVKNKLHLSVAGEKGLGSCAVCSCVLKLKVWVPITRILPQPGDDFPSHCWVLAESNLP